MESVDYAETPNDQAADLQNFIHRRANLPNAARGQAKSCPLCRTLNHPLSRECFNCGWRGTVPLSAAAASSTPHRLFQTWLVFFRRLSAWCKRLDR